MARFAKLFKNSSDIEILPLTSAHSEPVAELHTTLFHRGWDGSECDSLLMQPNVFGFYTRPTTKDSVSGFVLTRVAADEAEILSIGTEKTNQKTGLGWRMMQAAIGEASHRGARKMFLEVDEKNKPALGLYRKIGFQTVGERQAYYTDGDNNPSNALVLELKLN